MPYTKPFNCDAALPLSVRTSQTFRRLLSPLTIHRNNLHPLPAQQGFHQIRRLKMDNVAALLWWPFHSLANAGKWLAQQIRPATKEEKADIEDKETGDCCCMVFLGSCGAGVPVGSLYYIPVQKNMEV